jgi:hypothetical protein
MPTFCRFSLRLLAVTTISPKPCCGASVASAAGCVSAKAGVALISAMAAAMAIGEAWNSR